MLLFSFFLEHFFVYFHAASEGDGLKRKKNLLWVSMIDCTTLCNMAVQKYLEVHTVMECLGLTTAQHLYSYE